MSNVSRTAALSIPPDTGELEGDAVLSPAGILEWLWTTFTSMRLALALMLGLAVLALVGSVVIQAPPGIAADPAAYAEWLQGLKPRYGGFTTIFDKLGLFAVFQSVWFRALAVALTTSILACSAKRAPTLWKAAVHPRTQMSDRFFESAPYSEVIVTPATQSRAAELTRNVFRAHHFRTVLEHDARADATHLYVDQYRWAPFGTVIAHLSVVVILAGAMIGSMFGYRDEGLAVPVGSTVAVGDGTGLSVKAVSFSDSYYESGAPSDYASTLVLYRDGSEVATKTIRVNDPLEYDGVSFFQSFFGPAAVLQVSDRAGNVLFSDGVPLLWSSEDDTRRIGRLTLDDAGVDVFVVGVASGRVDPLIRAGQMQLELYRRGGPDQPFAIETVSQGEPLEVGDLTYTLVREQQFTGLIVARDPGQTLVWIGALALILGVFLVFLFPNRRIWIVVRGRAADGGEVRLGATARHDAGFAPEFNKLVEQVRQALSPAN